jgi:protein involved in polysaccharide export with SLBB domain
MSTSHDSRSPGWRGRRHGRARVALLLALCLVGGGASGCAALTNPLTDARPVRLLPPELLGPAKDPAHTIPLPLLGQPEPPAYVLGPGDVLGVYVENVLGDRTLPLPLQVAPLVEGVGQRRLPPAAGYPVPVRPDGTISMPQLEPVNVTGMTMAEVEDTLRKLYVAKEILKGGKERILVTLLHPRRHSVVVLRQESGNITLGPAGQIGGGKRGTGYVVDLPAYENDVLHALAETGGLPGLDAYDEVIVERGCFQDGPGRAAVLAALEHGTIAPGHPAPVLPCCKEIVRIPLRWPPGQPVPFHPADVILHTGDVVFLEARDHDVFYTGGLLPPGEHVLPRDRDLDVLEAVSLVLGPLVNGAFATNNLSGNLIAPGIGNPSPNLLVVVRRTPGGGQVPIRVDLDRALKDPRERLLVQPGDLLVLQETPAQALGRYFDQTFFNFDLFWTPLHERFATGAIDIATPDRLPQRLGTVQQTIQQR